MGMEGQNTMHDKLLMRIRVNILHSAIPHHACHHFPFCSAKDSFITTNEGGRNEEGVYSSAHFVPYQLCLRF